MFASQTEHKTSSTWCSQITLLYSLHPLTPSPYLNTAEKMQQPSVHWIKNMDREKSPAIISSGARKKEQVSQNILQQSCPENTVSINKIICVSMCACIHCWDKTLSRLSPFQVRTGLSPYTAPPTHSPSFCSSSLFLRLQNTPKKTTRCSEEDKFTKHLFIICFHHRCTN